MDSEDRPPLNWEASDTPTHPTVSATLPSEVIECLRNARFLHLATCTSLQPHISLMSYTYLPSTPFSGSPTIIMTTNPSSRKTLQLVQNPNVSLLVHDWISSRTSTAGSPERPRRASSSLASMLLGINSASLGRISATITGTARVLESGSEEEKWCIEKHVESHGYKESAIEDAPEDSASRSPNTSTEHTSAGFLQGQDVRVVVVKVQEGRIADWKGGVKDFVIREVDTGNSVLVNGV